MSRNANRETIFKFKHFDVINRQSGMKVGTDAVLLGALAPADVQNTRHILDIGAGTGVISLILAQRCPAAQITGVEIDPTASHEANTNFAASPYIDRLDIANCDINDFANSEHAWDLIVSNPPYFNETLHSPSGQRALARHDDKLPINLLMANIARLLASDGVAAVIYPYDKDNEVIYQATTNRLCVNRMIHILTTPAKPPRRTISIISRRQSGITVSTLYIRDADNMLTDEYASLVAPYYISVK